MPSNRRLIGLIVGDDPAVWAAAGFRVEEDHVDVGGVRIRLAGRDGGPGIRGWSFEPAWTQPIDGLPVDDAVPPSTSPSDMSRTTPVVHHNGVSAIDHVVVASPDVERTTLALGDARIEARRSIVGARGDADVVYRFFLLGTCVLELIGPATAPEAPAADQPARFAGLAFTTAAIDELGDVAGEPRPAIQPGRRIATLRREIGVSVPVAFLTPR